MRKDHKNFLPVFSFLVAIGTLFNLYLPTHAAEKKSKERLAVMDIEAKRGTDKELAEALSIIVRDKLHSFGDYQVMSKSDIQAVASREQLQQTIGCDDGTSQCLVNFGRAIGTRFMVAGDISKIGSTYTISLRLLDTKSDSAGVINRVSESCKCDEDDLIGTAEIVAAELAGKPTLGVQKAEVDKKQVGVERSFSNKLAPDPQQESAEAEKQHQASLAEKNRKAGEKRLAAEVEAERIRLAEEKKKSEKEMLSKEKEQAEENERQQAEKQRLTVETAAKKKQEEEKTKKLAELLKEEEKLAAKAEESRAELAAAKAEIEEVSRKKMSTEPHAK